VLANDDLVRVIGVALIADVVELADGRAVACQHPVAPGAGEQATKLRLRSHALLGTLIPDPLLHSEEA
jgi:hypothetical protein